MTSVVFEEIPCKVSLAVAISECRGKCIGCHSPCLRQSIGEELTFSVAESLLDDNFGVDCFLFLGEGNDRKTLLDLAKSIKVSKKDISLALYSGRKEVGDEYYGCFDYIKIGPYHPEYGPLNSKTTNQRLYKINKKGRNTIKERTGFHPFFGDKGIFELPSDEILRQYDVEDITHLFWKK